MKNIINTLLLLTSLVYLLPTLHAQESENVSLIGRWADGPCNAVATDGTIVFFGNGANLQVADFSNPANPIELAKIELSAPLTDLTLDGTYAYITAGLAGLIIFDISNPAKPIELGSYKISPATIGDFNGIAVQGNYAYVTTRSVFYIIDISDPENPQRDDSFTGIRDGKSVAVSGNYAYVADGNKGLRILDISDSKNTTEVSLLGTGSYFAPAQDIAISGNFAFVAISYGGLITVDISDPANPTQIDSVGTKEYANGIAINGNKAFISNGFDGMRIFDISNPADLSSVGSFDISGWAEGIAISGNDVYIADNHFGLHAISASNSANPQAAGFFATANTARNITVNGNYAYVADGIAGMAILDVSDPAKPIDLSFFQPGSSARDIFIVGTTAFLAAGSAGLRIVDISDPANPTEIGSYDIAKYGSGNTSGYAHEVFVRGDYAYVAAGYQGLIILNISNPANPTEASVFGPFRTWGFDIQGDFAYLEGSTIDGLRIADISNPQLPQQVALIDTIDANAVAVSGNSVFVVEGLNGVRTYDITDPANPVSAGFFKVRLSDASLKINGNFAYATGYFSGLHVFDLSDPANLKEVGFYNTYGNSQGVDVEDGLIYLADGSGGVHILQHNPSTSIIEEKLSTPAQIHLAQNYPNPFNPTTTISYELAQTGFVTLKIYDLRGREVATLVQDEKDAGSHTILFDASKLASGVYVYRLQTEVFQLSRKLILLK
ncbi:MAG: T9SS C-terminal target domain-containing protein [Calditrichaeota bacterium]|nr:MAG: T9SS C-terminal target domain-containing protein [Calditrichota bacterium]